MADSDVLRKVVNSSGFPLQTAIENLVNKSSDSQEGWRVSSTEHAWKNRNTNTEGFIDILLCNSCDTLFLVLECKRVLDSSWIFLQPFTKMDPISHVKAWVSRIADAKEKNFDWVDVTAEPATAQAGFCVVAGQDSKSRPMLERVAADVVDATEALAFEELSFLRENADGFRMYFNVIVTTAELHLCSFDPEKISLKDGKLSDAQFVSVPYLRFRKQLSIKNDPYSFVKRLGYQGFLRAKENTVFIVNASHFLEFLQAFSVDNNSVKRFI